MKHRARWPRSMAGGRAQITGQTTPITRKDARMTAQEQADGARPCWQSRPDSVVKGHDAVSQPAPDQRRQHQNQRRHQPQAAATPASATKAISEEPVDNNDQSKPCPRVPPCLRSSAGKAPLGHQGGGRRAVRHEQSPPPARSETTTSSGVTREHHQQRRQHSFEQAHCPAHPASADRGVSQPHAFQGGAHALQTPASAQKPNTPAANANTAMQQQRQQGQHAITRGLCRQ